MEKGGKMMSAWDSNWTRSSGSKREGSRLPMCSTRGLYMRLRLRMCWGSWSWDGWGWGWGRGMVGCCGLGVGGPIVDIGDDTVIRWAWEPGETERSAQVKAGTGVLVSSAVARGGSLVWTVMVMPMVKVALGVLIVAVAVVATGGWRWW